MTILFTTYSINIIYTVEEYGDPTCCTNPEEVVKCFGILFCVDSLDEETEQYDSSVIAKQKLNTDPIYST